MNERSILILSNGKRAQIAERGIAGAEIVHRDADAERAQAVQRFERQLAYRRAAATSVISSSSRLGVEPGVVQRRSHLVDERRGS